MDVLLITFRLRDLDDATYRQQTEQHAPLFAVVPGLVAKTWLADSAPNRYGGGYHFADRAALDAYLASPIVDGLRQSPHYADLSIQVFGTIAAATRITGGALSGAAAEVLEGGARERAA